MCLCWQAPAQRPSLRELRIMLLHLRSSRDDDSALGGDDTDFDRKWNQLMPRQMVSSGGAVPGHLSPIVVHTGNANSDDDDDSEFTLDDIRGPIGSPVEPNLLARHIQAGGGPSGFVRPASFDSEFETNASLLAQAGSLRSLSLTSENLVDDEANGVSTTTQAQLPTPSPSPSPQVTNTGVGGENSDAKKADVIVNSKAGGEADSKQTDDRNITNNNDITSVSDDNCDNAPDQKAPANIPLS